MWALGGQLSSRSAWWSQLGTESLVLGLPASPKCPHRKCSASVAVMGPRRVMHHAHALVLLCSQQSRTYPHIELGEKWLISCQLEIRGLRLKTEVDLWEMEEVVFVTCLCLKVITATHVFSLGGRECIRESPSFSDIERRVETYCLFSWLIQLREWMWNSASECLSSLLFLGKKLIVLNLLLRKSSFNGNIQRRKKKKKKIGSEVNSDFAMWNYR